MKLLEKLFGGSHKDAKNTSVPVAQDANALTITWTRERLTHLFGAEFSRFLEPPGQGTLNCTGKLMLLTMLASELQSGKTKITGIIHPQALAAGIEVIVAKEALVQYLTTAKGPSDSQKEEMLRTLRQTVDSQETTQLLLRMVGEEIRRLKSGGQEPQPSQEGSRAEREISDAEMLKILHELCDAYVADDKGAIARLEPHATQIGEELNRRGGIEEMRRIFYALGPRRGARTLEMHWDGIGDWRG